MKLYADFCLHFFFRHAKLMVALCTSLNKVFLGGRAAEEVIYGRDTSRASVNYLADASWLARKIITMYVLIRYNLVGVAVSARAVIFVLEQMEYEKPNGHTRRTSPLGKESEVCGSTS